MEKLNKALDDLGIKYGTVDDVQEKNETLYPESGCAYTFGSDECSFCKGAMAMIDS